MRLIDINHRDPGMMSDDIGIDLHVTHLRVDGAGVVVTLIQRDGGIDITVNPAGTDYMHHVKMREVAVNSTQVRISGVQGSPLG